MKEKNDAEKNTEISTQIESWYIQWMLVDRLYTEFALQYGVTSTAVFTLRTILEKPENCTQRIICETLNMPKQTVSSLLVELEKKGYVIKEKFAQDKRNSLISLTNAGKEFIQKILADLCKSEEEAFFSLSTEDRKAFTRINEALTEALRDTMHAGENERRLKT